MVLKPKSFTVGLILVALFATLIASLYVYDQYHKKIVAQANIQQDLMLDLRQSAIERFFSTMESEIVFWSEETSLQTNIQQIIQGWQTLQPNANESLRQRYIDNNPHPVGKKGDLDLANDGSNYSQVHKALQLRVRKFIKLRQYYDVFIIDPQGNLIYTYAKEDDYATNLLKGPWQNTGLADVFRSVSQSHQKNTVALVDFAAYAPSYGELASFIATSVEDPEGELMAVIAFQVPIENISKIMQFSEAMGETGETYLIGDDLLMRSNSRFSEMPTMLRTKVETETAKLALKGLSGVQFTSDYRGIPVLSVYAPLHIKGLKWAILSEKDEAEILEPVHALRDKLFIAGILISLLMLVSSIAVVSFFNRKS